MHLHLQDLYGLFTKLQWNSFLVYKEPQRFENNIYGANVYFDQNVPVTYSRHWSQIIILFF